MKHRIIRTITIACIISLIWCPLSDAVAKSDEQRLYIIAKGAYQDGLYDVAIGQLEKFLKGFPKSTLTEPVRLMLAESYYQKNNFPAAIPYYQKLLDASQFDYDKINYRLGYCYYRTDKFSHVAAAFSRISRNEKTEKYYAEILYLMAESLLRVKEYKQAEKNFHNFLDEFPKHHYYKKALFGLGLSQFGDMRFAASLASLKKFVGEYPPLNLRARAQFLIGFSLEKIKEYSQAIAAYEKFLSNYPDDSRVDEVRLRLGLTYFETGAYARSAPLLAKYANTHPEKAAPVIFKIGVSYLRLNKYDRAQKYFKILITDSLGSSYGGEAWYYLGYCYLKQNQKKLALKVFREIIKLYSTTEIAWASFLQIGIIQAENKSYKTAIAAFKKALSSKKKALAAEAQYRLAIAVQQSRETDLALDQFRRVKKNFPNQKEWVELAQLKVAETLAAQGNFSDAMKNLRGLSTYRQAAAHLINVIRAKKDKSR